MKFTLTLRHVFFHVEDRLGQIMVEQTASTAAFQWLKFKDPLADLKTTNFDSPVSFWITLPSCQLRPAMKQQYVVIVNGFPCILSALWSKNGAAQCPRHPLPFSDVSDLYADCLRMGLLGELRNNYLPLCFFIRPNGVFCGTTRLLYFCIGWGDRRSFGAKVSADLSYFYLVWGHYHGWKDLDRKVLYP